MFLFLLLLICLYVPRIFENRVTKNINSFYYLAYQNNKTHLKADEKPLYDAGQYVNGP